MTALVTWSECLSPLKAPGGPPLEATEVLESEPRKLDCKAYGGGEETRETRGLHIKRYTMNQRWACCPPTC